VTARLRSYRHVLLAGAALAALALLVLSQAGAPSDPGPMTVTTDTIAYCDELAEKVDAEREAHPPGDPEIGRLAAEGRQMCDTGLIRGGLIRLRRALLLLEATK
jgi:hypothetical protein